MTFATAAHITPFRQTEKHYKSRASKGRLPSLRRYPVLDLSRPEKKEDDPVWTSGWWSPVNDAAPDLYPNGNERRSIAKGKARELGERPSNLPSGMRAELIRLASGTTGYVVADGCILIPGYCGIQQQLDLLVSAVAEYTLPPNPLSLSTHYDLPPNLFELFQSQSPDMTQPLFEQFDTERQDLIREARRERDARTTAEVESGYIPGVPEILSSHKAWRGDLPAEGLGQKTAEELMRELRWANLGLIYKWTTKMYDLEPAAAIPFPPDLAGLCQGIVRDVPWANVFSPEDLIRLGAHAWPNDYGERERELSANPQVPDTGIVNFYNRKDTLMGHVDRSELDPYRPLVSISLGHAAIFLLGTNTRDVQPLPIILRSGDVLIMSGKGRECYHGIPRILEGTLPSYFAPCEGDNNRLLAAKRWISTGRININARQVYPPSMKPDRAMHEP